ncbi:MAG: PACE efflux transporter [Rubrivivax sp.]|nr:MAG: PACE efflux transporter [Rubrivivax sp.]
MQGTMRRLVYVGLYELIAVVMAGTALALMSGQGLVHTGSLAVVMSVVAVVWNVVFNHFFERWEARQTVKGRSFKRRAAHAVGFEIGLLIMLVPIIAWWLEVGLWEALVMDVGMALFFLVYTFVFNWCFDRVFGLPASAQPA